MSIRETSGYESTNEFRTLIGLQFFADSGDSGDMSADMDGDISSAFEAGLMDDGLENQQPTGQDTGEDTADGLENQQPEGQRKAPENNEGGNDPSHAQQQEPPKVVPLTYNGQQIMLPDSAVQALRGALGFDPVELLQKGMNYDRKAERELRVLDQFAAASGMSRAQYLGQLEAMQRKQELDAEIDKCRSEFPETSDAALQEIAKNRVAAKYAAVQQQAMRQHAAVRQVQQRAQAAIQIARANAMAKEWDRYEAETGIHTPDKIPPRVMDLVQQGKSPMEAHLIYTNEQSQHQLAILRKQEQNRNSTPGSMAGGGDEHDDFLSGLFG